MVWSVTAAIMFGSATIETVTMVVSRNPGEVAVGGMVTNTVKDFVACGISVIGLVTTADHPWELVQSKSYELLKTPVF